MRVCVSDDGAYEEDMVPVTSSSICGEQKRWTEPMNVWKLVLSVVALLNFFGEILGLDVPLLRLHVVSGLFGL